MAGMLRAVGALLRGRSRRSGEGEEGRENAEGGDVIRSRARTQNGMRGLGAVSESGDSAEEDEDGEIEEDEDEDEEDVDGFEDESEEEEEVDFLEDEDDEAPPMRRRRGTGENEVERRQERSAWREDHEMRFEILVRSGGGGGASWLPGSPRRRNSGQASPPQMTRTAEVGVKRAVRRSPRLNVVASEENVEDHVNLGTIKGTTGMPVSPVKPATPGFLQMMGAREIGGSVLGMRVPVAGASPRAKGARQGFAPNAFMNLTQRWLPNKSYKHDLLESRVYIGQWSADGESFVAGFQNQLIRVYDTTDVRKWKVRKDIECRDLRWTITDTCFSPDQRFCIYTTMSPPTCTSWI